MQTSARGVAFIAAHEGVVTRAYRDTAAGRSCLTVTVAEASRRNSERRRTIGTQS